MPGKLAEVPKKRGKKATEEPADQAQKRESPPKYVPVATGPFPPWPKGGGRAGLCDIEELLAYWRSLPAEFINRTNFYVNREHPKLDRLQEYAPEQILEMKQHTRRYPAKYIDKPALAWEPEETRMAFLRRYGSGDFTLWLNDAGTSSKKTEAERIDSRNLCKAQYKVWDSAYPPILDPSRPDKGIGILDWTYPGNASYISELRLKGITPPGEKEKDSDMDKAIVESLVDKVGSLADKVAVHEQDKLVERIAEKVNPGGNQGTSGAMQILEAFKLGKESSPPPNSATENSLLNTVVTLLTTQIKSSQEETKALREQVMNLIEKKQNGSENKDGIAGFEALIEKAEKIIPKLKGLFGEAGDAATNVIHGRPRRWYEEVAIQTLPGVAHAAMPILQTIAARFMGPAPQLPTLNGMQPAPAQIAAPGQPAQPQAQNPMQQAGSRVMGFIQSNIRPIQKHFEDFVTGKAEDGRPLDGSDFAYWILEYHGEGLLQDIRMLGTGNILALFKSTPYWGAIAPHEAKLMEFLDQIMRFEPADEPLPDKADDNEPTDLTLAHPPEGAI